MEERSSALQQTGCSRIVGYSREGRPLCGRRVVVEVVRSVADWW